MKIDRIARHSVLILATALALFAAAPTHAQEDPLAERRVWGELAAQGDVQGMWRFGRLLRDGRGGLSDPEAAFFWLRKAALAGHRVAERDVAHAYLIGSGTPADPAAAAIWLHRGAQRGDAEAQYQFALLLIAGVAEGPNPEAAVPWLQRAADQGHIRAQRRLDRLAPDDRKPQGATVVEPQFAEDVAEAPSVPEPVEIAEDEPAAPEPVASQTADAPDAAPRPNLRAESLQLAEAPADPVVPEEPAAPAPAPAHDAIAAAQTPADRQEALHAALGDPVALFDLARQLHQDDPASENRAMAYALWRESARLGHAPAATAVANVGALLSQDEIARADAAFATFRSDAPQ